MSLCTAKGFLELPTVLGLPWASPPLPALPWCCVLGMGAVGRVPAVLAAGPWGEGKLGLPACLMPPCHDCPRHVLVPAEVDGETRVSAGSGAALACQLGHRVRDACAMALAAEWSKWARTGRQGEGDQRWRAAICLCILYYILFLKWQSPDPAYVSEFYLLYQYSCSNM